MFMSTSVRWIAAALMLVCLLFVEPNVAFDPSNSNKPKPATTDEAKGIVLLDSFTYPILVNKHSPHATFVFAMNKRDIGDYGSDSIRSDFYGLALDFLKLIDDADTHKLLFAQVLVNGASNAKLGAKLGLKPSTKGPVFGIIPAGSDGESESVIPYTGRLDQMALFAFIKEHVDVRVMVSGTDDRFNSLVQRFVDEFRANPPVLPEATDAEASEAADKADPPVLSDELTAVLEESKALLQSIRQADGSDSEAATLGEHYMKALSKVARSGKLATVHSEVDRMQHIIKRKEKVAPHKLREAIQRRQVYMVFRAFMENAEGKERKAQEAAETDEREL